MKYRFQFEYADKKNAFQAHTFATVALDGLRSMFRPCRNYGELRPQAWHFSRRYKLLSLVLVPVWQRIDLKYRLRQQLNQTVRYS